MDGFELLEQLFYANDSAYQICGSPNYIALRDSRGYVQVALVNGAIPPPFEDTNNDGLADVDGNGNFITSDGSVPPSPFDAVGASPATRDGCGRALRTGSGGGSEDAGAGPTPGGQDAGAGEDGGCAAVSPCAGVPASALLYNYIDTSSVFATSLLQHTYPLVNPNPTARHETVMYALAGLRSSSERATALRPRASATTRTPSIRATATTRRASSTTTRSRRRARRSSTSSTPSGRCSAIRRSTTRSRT